MFSVEKLEFDRTLFEAGIRSLEAGGDFSDGVIAAEAARAKCLELVTFDRKLAKTSAQLGCKPRLLGTIA